MSDGHGGDGEHCFDSHDRGGDAAYALGFDGTVPLPGSPRLSVNGAPVTDTSHALVIRPAANGRSAYRITRRG